MGGQEEDANGLVIKIPASLLSKQDRTREQQNNLAKHYNFFAKTGIVKIQKKLITEHGETEVQSLGFADADQRQKVLNLLDNPILYAKLPELLHCIYDLGCQADGEKRYHAAVAASELATKQPFLDLKEAFILPWAKNDNPWIRDCAAVALAHMVEHKRNESEVLLLLKHWITNNNAMLVNTALSTFSRIVRSHKTEVLEAVKITLKNGNFFQCLEAIELFGLVYDVSSIESIEQLFSWLIPIKNTKLCRMAPPLFLIFIRLEDATESENVRAMVVEMILNLWDTPASFMYPEIQEQTALKIQQWATEVLGLWNKESPDVLQRYLALFHELDRKYDEKNRNRLRSHLERWERNRQRELKRNRRRKPHEDLESIETVSYHRLIS